MHPELNPYESPLVDELLQMDGTDGVAMKSTVLKLIMEYNALRSDLNTMYTRIVSTHAVMRNKPCIPENIRFVKMVDAQASLFDTQPLPTWTTEIDTKKARLTRQKGDLWTLEVEDGTDTISRTIFAQDLYDLAMGVERAGLGPVTFSPSVG